MNQKSPNDPFRVGTVTVYKIKRNTGYHDWLVNFYQDHQRRGVAFANFDSAKEYATAVSRAKLDGTPIPPRPPRIKTRSKYADEQAAKEAQRKQWKEYYARQKAEWEEIKPLMLGPTPREIQSAKLSARRKGCAFNAMREGLVKYRQSIPQWTEDHAGPSPQEIRDGLEKRRRYQAHRRYTERNRQAINERKKRARKTPEGLAKQRVRSIQWRLRNPEKAKQIWKRSNSDPKRKFAHRLRVRLSKFYRGRNVGGALGLTGLTRDALFQHLTSQLKPGMTVENYGKVWHIDHIVPCAAFNLEDINEVRRCFHYTNLRPEFAKANMSKGKKFAGRTIELPMTYTA